MELLPTNAYLIGENDEITLISPENGEDFELEEAQKYVDGYIEIVHLNEDQIMIVNEEGKFYKGYNQIATGIAELHHSIGPGDYIAGDVIICPSGMLK